MKKIISFVMVLAIVAATAVAPSVPASAEQTDIWQVNGKYTLTKKKLVTYCALYSAPIRERTLFVLLFRVLA